MEGIMLCIPEDGKSENKLISLLYTIFTNKLTGREKKIILEEKFSIHLSNKEAEIMEVTNGLASYVMEKAAKEGYGQGYGKGYGQGYDQGYDLGIEKGIERGIEQGIEQGIKQGIEQGIIQGAFQKTKEAVCLMNEKGLDKDSIAMYLNLSVEKVEEFLEKQ